MSDLEKVKSERNTWRKWCQVAESRETELEGALQKIYVTAHNSLLCPEEGDMEHIKVIADLALSPKQEDEETEDV